MTTVRRLGDPVVARDALLFPAAGPTGPAGPVGPPGPAAALPATWWGDGPPPDLVPGSKPGDSYVDRITGDTYTLE